MEFTFGFEITVECFCLNKRKTMSTLSSWPRCDLCTLDVVGLKVVSGDTDGAVTEQGVVSVTIIVLFIIET